MIPTVFRQQTITLAAEISRISSNSAECKSTPDSNFSYVLK